VIEGSETKTGQPVDVPFPLSLVAYLERYLKIFRPRLLRDARDALWISRMGKAQSPGCIYTNIKHKTAKAFGQPINLHLFRDCAATSIALEEPAQIAIVSSVLGHASLQTSLTHYNQARSIDASRKLQAAFAAMRQEYKSKCRTRGNAGKLSQA